MIATVRIAPIERWCEEVLDGSKHLPQRAQLPGMEIQIEPSSLYDGSIGGTCTGKHWKASRESQDRIDKIIHGHTMRSASWWCEHMLEMD